MATITADVLKTACEKVVGELAAIGKTDFETLLQALRIQMLIDDPAAMESLAKALSKPTPSLFGLIAFDIAELISKARCDAMPKIEIRFQAPGDLIQFQQALIADNGKNMPLDFIDKIRAGEFAWCGVPFKLS